MLHGFYQRFLFDTHSRLMSQRAEQQYHPLIPLHRPFKYPGESGKRAVRDHHPVSLPYFGPLYYYESVFLAASDKIDDLFGCRPRSLLASDDFPYAARVSDHPEMGLRLELSENVAGEKRLYNRAVLP